MVLGLLDYCVGKDEIKELNKEFNIEVDYVCSSHIYDNLFKFVRENIR